MIEIDATSLPRFMACRGNITLTVPAVPSSSDNTVRDEGNAFHKVAELLWHGHDPATLVDTKAYNGVLITAEMLEHAQEYLTGLDRDGAIETDTSWSSIGINVRGRADYARYDSGSGTIDITDAKYGYRTVEPEMNWTLISHAIGVWRSVVISAPVVNRVVFRIYQPRSFHPDGPWRAWDITGAELVELCDQLVRHALHASPELRTSEHCRDCPAAAFCPALRDASMSVLDAIAAPVEDRLTADQVARHLSLMNRAEAILKARTDALDNLALHLLQQGQVLPGWGLKDCYGQTAWAKGLTATDIGQLLGIDARLDKPVTPAEARRRGASEEDLATITTRPFLRRELTPVDANKAVKRLLKGK